MKISCVFGLRLCKTHRVAKLDEYVTRHEAFFNRNPADNDFDT
jgi:hypothetical protein